MPDTIEPQGGRPYPPDMEARVAVLEQIARSIDAAFERIDRRFDGIERRFEAIERRLDAMDGRIDATNRRIDALEASHRADFRWLLGVMLGGFAGMFATMAHGFHWF